MACGMEAQDLKRCISVGVRSSGGGCQSVRGEDGAASGVWGDERGVRWRGGGVREEGVDGGGMK